MAKKTITTQTAQTTPAKEVNMEESPSPVTEVEAVYNNNVHQQGVNMDISTFTSNQLINELVSRGILTADFADKESKRRDRAIAKAAKLAAVSTAKTGIMAVLENTEFTANKYFSVKKTGNSIGFMSHVTGERSVVLKALTQLVQSGQIRKIGLVKGEEKPTSEVNAFQIRYARVTEAEVQTEEADAEVAEEGK